MSRCCKPVRGNRTRWGCCSCNGIQRDRAEALLQGKHRGFILPEAQMHKVLFFFLLLFLTPNTRIATSAWLLLIQDTFKMIFIKHLSIKRVEAAHPCRMGVQGDLNFQGGAGLLFRHHKEVREVEPMQKVTLPFPSKRGLGFARSSKRWHTPIHFQRNLAALMPLRPACFNARQMLAMPSAYPPKYSAHPLERAATNLFHIYEAQG